jgi:predicted RNase H-like HicB family nuclease
MLKNYIRAAMGKARYEILPDDGTFYGEIPGFEGVYANADTLEACRDELEEVLEGWILLRVSLHYPLPSVDGMGEALDLSLPPKPPQIPHSPFVHLSNHL